MPRRLARSRLVLLGTAMLGVAACSVLRLPAASSPSAAPAPLPSPMAAVPAPLNARLLSQASPPTVDADLPIGAGDLIEVSVFEVEELSKLKLRIPLRGTITLPLLGAIPAAGRTAIELQEDLRERLRQKYMHDPHVSVFVHEHQSQRISVVGAVRKGGTYTLASRLRLADALAMAEGLTEEADHLIFLIRRLPAGTVVQSQPGVGPGPAVAASHPSTATEEVMVAVDLDALASGKEELNVPLQAGDVVHVPRASSYYVGGSVERPGSFLLKSKTTLEQAILAAGDVRDVAAWDDVRLYRVMPSGERQVLTFNLNEIEKGQPTLEVQKHDVIIVGKSASKAFWYGAFDFFRGVLGLSKGI